MTPREEINRRRREAYASDTAVREKRLISNRLSHARMKGNDGRSDVQRAQRRKWYLNGGDEQVWVSRLKIRYGLTKENYNELLEKQSGVCAICRGPQKAPTRRLDVDHCHKSGVVRGLLCDHCNKAIAFLQDNPELLRKVASYVEAAKVTE